MHKKDFYEENLFIIHCTHITGNDSLIGCSDWTESEAKTFPESIVSMNIMRPCVPINRQITKLHLVGLVAGVVKVPI